MSRKRALNFDQWKTFSEKYKSISYLISAAALKAHLIEF